MEAIIDVPNYPSDGTLETHVCDNCSIDVLTLLLCNVYMPGDTLYDQNNVEEFIDILGEVTTLSVKLVVDHGIVGGDFNTDFQRLNSLYIQ